MHCCMLWKNERAIEVMPMDSYRTVMAMFLQRWIISSNYPVECLKGGFGWIRCSFHHDREPELYSLYITPHTFGISQELWSWQIVKVWYFWCAVWWKVFEKHLPWTYTPPFRSHHCWSNYVLYRSFKIPFYSAPPFMWLCRQRLTPSIFIFYRLLSPPPPLDLA